MVQMNFGVILAGLHAVICKEDHLKICELIMNILDVLFGLAVISSTDEHHDRMKINWTNAEPMNRWYEQINAKDDEKYQLAVDIILRL